MRVMGPKSSPPFQCDPNIPGNATRKIHDLHAQLVSKRAELAIPELIDLLRNTGECALPTRLLLIDRSSLIRAHAVWEPIDLDLAKAISGCALNDSRSLPHHLFV